MLRRDAWRKEKFPRSSRRFCFPKRSCNNFFMAPPEQREAGRQRRMKKWEMSSFQKKLKSLHISCGVGGRRRGESSDEIREISLWFIIKTKDSPPPRRFRAKWGGGVGWIKSALLLSSARRRSFFLAPHPWRRANNDNRITQVLSMAMARGKRATARVKGRRRWGMKVD